MSEFWHAMNVARFSWTDLLVFWAIVGPGWELGRAFVRGWRRRAAQDRERAARQRYRDAVRTRRDA